MMSLPFFGLLVALAFTGTGHRGLAVLFWLLSIAVLLALFRLHATDPLDIVL
ncbi:putative transmembrane protein [Ancylobacter novellus DSM 506]|jgi:hypothetical protein|uniref:Transmembrane protein n=1 Tax=Ancylobacter novellus (strain ATCC 8093 / DSM 506 / JCM 20403 / CCM 1077 / IAM 12100 / NBRC 12443 / NCIMB 10456) TaxID=639283 RepID=D7A8Q0_ANCN5|nr:DUF5993 family protein [Ancylobacter novellus]ADH90584.1 putative transmembrane protein [Ancylobacter novellus DSM 506]